MKFDQVANNYMRMYLESDHDFRDQATPSSAEVYEPEARRKEAQAEVNQDKGLKKYTYEILYKTDHKFDPKTKKVVSWAYKSHSSGRPDLRHVFAHSEDEFWAKMDKTWRGSHGDELENRIILKKEEPADLEEVEREKSHAETMHDYYHGPGSENRYFGD